MFTSNVMLTQSEIDIIIAQARMMRSKFISQSINSGFACLRSLFRPVIPPFLMGSSCRITRPFSVS